MAIPASGAISLDDIQTEWGGSNPIGMSEYYGDGSYVYDGAADGDDNAIPESGAIDISDFYDTTAATVLTISSNTNNYNIKSAVQSAGADLNTPVLLTIASGVTVGAANNSAPAMKTDTGWGSGVSITITNQGSIVGGSGSDTSGNPSSGGGSGGASRPNWPGFGHPMYGYPGGAGSGASAQAGSSNNGGTAFEHSQTGDNNLSVVFATAGTRTGGSAGAHTVGGNGGGGGGGAGSRTQHGAGGGAFVAKGGSGGGGAANGSGASSPGSNAGAGSNGNATQGGAGGGGGTSTNIGPAGAGGAGGDLGQAGSSGGGGNDGSPGSGGAAGSNASANGSAGSALAGNTDQIS